MGRLWCIEGSKVHSFAPAEPDRSGPHWLARSWSSLHSKQPRLIVASGVALVLQIFFVRHVSKILPAVVGGVAVNVIDMVFWPFASDVEPYKTMNQILAAKDTGIEIPVRHFRTNGLPEIADSAAAPAIRCLQSDPRQNAGFRGVVKKLAQTRGSKIGSSHEAVLSLIGQRPVSVASTERASLFYVPQGAA